MRKMIICGALGIPPEMESQLTPEQRARYEAAMKMMGNGKPRVRTYKGCLTEKERTEDPFTDMNQYPKIKCRQTVIKSAGSDLEVKESCMEETSKADIHMTFHASSPEHVTGTGTIVGTMGGGTMNSNMKMESKWLAATCPADVK
ncbi:MAG TPA: DUF3617 family protein [Patescibacteria group bacterium]|nr:DUF3617 family protein [Patescibacteria group bacterium]